ncbi:hypothetical protein Q1695_010708 [Nippostrongylus brasiliensis]|nr:hypothetical protein Q1695_010708 [Nippostrongylus brasiliensis]
MFREERFIEYHDMSPDSIDVFTVLAVLFLIIGIILMVYWLLSIFKKPLSEDFEDTEEESTRRSSAGYQPDYISATSQDSPSMEVVIDRPPHALSDRQRKSRRILSSSNEHFTHLESAHALAKGTPVLNVIWEPVSAKGSARSMKSIRSAQLISTAPLYIRRQTRGGIVEEPITLNVFLEPLDSKKQKERTAPDSTTTARPIPYDTEPSITLTTTTTKTTVTSPGPGFAKRVTEVHSKTRHVKKLPADDQVYQLSSRSDAEEVEKSADVMTAVEVPLFATRMQKQDSTLTETTQVVTKSSQAPPCCATKTNTSIGEGPVKAGDTVQSDESKLKTVAVLPKNGVVGWKMSNVSGWNNVLQFVCVVAGVVFVLGVIALGFYVVQIVTNTATIMSIDNEADDEFSNPSRRSRRPVESDIEASFDEERSRRAYYHKKPQINIVYKNKAPYDAEVRNGILFVRHKKGETMPMTAVPSPARKAISKDGKPEIKTPATTAHAPMTRSGAGNADACTPVVFNIRAGTPVSVNVVENSKIKAAPTSHTSRAVEVSRI